MYGSSSVTPPNENFFLRQNVNVTASPGVHVMMFLLCWTARGRGNFPHISNSPDGISSTLHKICKQVIVTLTTPLGYVLIARDAWVLHV